VVEELLNQGARIDLRDDDGRNALALAARAGERRVVELLLHRGASIDMRDDGDEKDREALQWVCEMVRNGQS
jgi:ankyrin repeat protein